MRNVRRARGVWALLDSVMSLASLPAGAVARAYAQHPERLPLAGRIWERSGVLPVPYHYYQPIVREQDLAHVDWTADSSMPGVDWSIEPQLALLRDLQKYGNDMPAYPYEASGSPCQYHYGNRAFGPGSAETLHAMLRHLRPRRLVEVGAGHSTLVARDALAKNRAEGHACDHICVEPYEMPWLDSLGDVHVIRRLAQAVEMAIFLTLDQNDVLFIDSSHVLRIGGDVQFLYLNILPRLRPGVHVHIHDIFLPREYPSSWVLQDKHFWTEQYVLQAFLSFNSCYEVALALNFLAAHYPQEVHAVCPVLAKHPDRQTSSFWLRRNEVTIATDHHPATLEKNKPISG